MSNSSVISMIAAMAGWGMYDYPARMDRPIGFRQHRGALEGIDLKKEYELIQQKKSKLTASQRSRVEMMVKRGDV